MLAIKPGEPTDKEFGEPELHVKVVHSTDSFQNNLPTNPRRPAWMTYNYYNKEVALQTSDLAS